MKLNVCVFLLLLCVIAVYAQESGESFEVLKIHDYESLRALEYDANLAKQKDAEALEAYLSGNILIGVWGKSNTRQYFSPSGSTWYQEEDSPQSHGTWRVRDDGKYCSVWPPSRHESCYEVSFIDDVLFWHSGKNRYPSTLQVISEDSEVDDIETDSDDS